MEGGPFRVPTLVLLNGPPAIGKSTVAEHLVETSPLTLKLDIDGIRTTLSGWRSHPESKTLAREIGVAMAAAHLHSGHSVVVPQLLGGVDFIETLDAVARGESARFVEVMLLGDPRVCAARFGKRRADLTASGVGHPENDVAEADIERTINASIAALNDVLIKRPNSLRVDASGDIETTCSLVAQAVGTL